MFTKLESELILENEKLKQKVFELKEEINYLEKANKRVRRKNKKYKKFINLINEKLELGVNKIEEKNSIENELYFINNNHWLINGSDNQELTYLEYELIKDVLKEIKR